MQDQQLRSVQPASPHFAYSTEHSDITTNRRGSAKRNAAFTLQHGAILTPRQPEGCVPVVVSSCARFAAPPSKTLAPPGAAR